MIKNDINDSDVSFVVDEDTGETEVHERSPHEEEEREDKEAKNKKKEDEVVPKEHYENLKKALQEARIKSKTEIESLRRRLEEYEKTLSEFQSSVKKDEFEELFKDYSDEDVITVAGVKKILEVQNKKLQEKEKQYEQMVAAVATNIAESMFREAHPDYDEIVSPFLDLLKDKKFLDMITSEGMAKAPKKFYEYCKKKMQEDTKEDFEAEKVGATELPSQIKGPATMSKKSKTESSKTDFSKLSLEEKRRMRLKEEDLDRLWLDMMGKK